MINLGTQICFNAMCLSYDNNAGEYHFKILEISQPFVIKNSKKAFKVEKSTMFRAACYYSDDTKHDFTLNGYDSEAITLNSSEMHKKFLRKSKILRLLYFWKKF